MLQFQIVRSQCSELFHDSLANAEPDEFRLDWWKNRILRIGASPLLEDRTLLGLVCQVQEDAGEEHTQQVFKKNVFLEIGRIRRITKHPVNDFVANGLVKNSARFVPPEIVCDTFDYLFEVGQEGPVVCQMFVGHSTTRSWRLGAELHGDDGGMDDFFATRTSQIPGQPWIGPQISQATLG
jgi:hypothetical protein